MRGATQSTRSIGFFLIFQSTLLMRGATAASISFSSAPSRFQSTLLMRGATGHHAVVLVEADISIHAPHARSDLCRLTVNSKLFYFNPRSSCEERRRISHVSSLSMRFQSTLLMRGATRPPRLLVSPTNFNPRSSCEERRGDGLMIEVKLDISIHAPHARSDPDLSSTSGACTLFQSTLLMRGATDGDGHAGGPAKFQSTLLMRGAT